MTTPAGFLHCRVLAVLAVASLSLAGCAGDDSTGSTDTDGSTSATATATATTSGSASATASSTSGSGSDSDSSGSTGSAGVSYVADIQTIWDNRCVPACHTPGGANASLPLESDVSYDNIVDKMSTQALSLKIVAPGSTTDSYLWHKLNGTHTEVGGNGNLMPLVPLPAAELATVEAWIKGGALP